MLRFVPAVRALYERVRRPDSSYPLRGIRATYDWVRRPQPLPFFSNGGDRRWLRFLDMRLGVVVVLIGSTTFLVAGLSDRMGMDSARAVPSSGAAQEGSGLSEKVSRAVESESSVARAWRERAMEREAARAAADFADAYRQYRVTPELAQEIHLAALRNDIEPEVAFGLVRVESSFRRTAVSWAGAVGYTQLLPSTAAYMVPGVGRSDLFETRTNLEIGFKYLRYLKDKYDGDLHLALTAYNRGPGTVDRLLRQGRNPDNGYAGKVMRGYS
jgi:soluble lytic murein transglycosylase-like protein